MRSVDVEDVGTVAYHRTNPTGAHQSAHGRQGGARTVVDACGAGQRLVLRIRVDLRADRCCQGDIDVDDDRFSFMPRQTAYRPRFALSEIRLRDGHQGVSHRGPRSRISLEVLAGRFQRGKHHGAFLVGQPTMQVDFAVAVPPRCQPRRRETRVISVSPIVSLACAPRGGHTPRSAATTDSSPPQSGRNTPRSPLRAAHRTTGYHRVPEIPRLTLRRSIPAQMLANRVVGKPLRQRRRWRGHRRFRYSSCRQS